MSSDNDTVGSLLASIANSISAAITTLRQNEDDGWGPDEHEQVFALKDTLDEAKKDFQELGPLVKGSWYYESDRIPDSILQLHALRAKFDAHAAVFTDWSRAGGPIHPLWARDTAELRVELHRAQRRAANRVFATQQEDSPKCLGAFELWRRQRRAAALGPKGQGLGLGIKMRGMGHERGGSRYELTRDEVASGVEVGGYEAAQADGNGGLVSPRWKGKGKEVEHRPIAQDEDMAVSRLPTQHGHSYESQHERNHESENTIPSEQHERPSPPQRRDRYSQQGDAAQADSLEQLVPICNEIGTFERFGDRDIAFTCDFCDGHIVWEDISALPSERTPLPPTVTNQPNWQASAKRFIPPPQPPDSSHPSPDSSVHDVEAGETELARLPEKTIVFAPLAIANHAMPDVGEWEARIFCPFCEEYEWLDQGGGGEDMRYDQGEEGFRSLREFQAHLEWYHSSMAMPAMPSIPSMSGLPILAGLQEKCVMM